MKFSRVEFYGYKYCSRNSAMAKTQNSASCANYNVNFKIFIVKFLQHTVWVKSHGVKFQAATKWRLRAKFKKAKLASGFR